jgi:hypothetical protein
MKNSIRNTFAVHPSQLKGFKITKTAYAALISMPRKSSHRLKGYLAL